MRSGPATVRVYCKSAVGVPRTDRKRTAVAGNSRGGNHLCRYVIRPLVKSYGDSSRETLSPFMILMRFRRSLPAIVARTVRPRSSSMENIPALNFSTTFPMTSIASSFGTLIFGNDFLYTFRCSTKNYVCGKRTGLWHVRYRPRPNPGSTSGFAASRRLIRVPLSDALH